MLPLLFLLVLACVPPSLANVPLGRRCIKSDDGKYLRVWKGPEAKLDWHADLAPHCLENERWELVDRRGFVSFKSVDGNYLSAADDGAVTVVKTEGESEMWEAFKNEDGTVSFQSAGGRWLSAYDAKGFVNTMPHNKKWEHFTLDAWNTTSTRNFTGKHPIPKRLLGEKCIRSTYDGRFIRVYENGDKASGDWRAYLEPTCAKGELWIIENRKGWTTIRTKDHLYLRSTAAGTVHLVQGLSRADRWEPFLNTDGSISFQAETGLWLSSFRPDGFVRTIDHNQDMERFTLEDWHKSFDTVETTSPKEPEPEEETTAEAPTEPATSPAVEQLLKACDGKHIFQTVHGAYLRAGTKDTEGLVDQAPAAKKWERWTVNSTGGANITLESYHGTFLRAFPAGGFDLVNYSRTWEQWTVIRNDADNTFTLQSPHGGYLSASDNGTLRIKPERGSWDHYSIGCYVETVTEEPPTTTTAPPPTTPEATSESVSKLLKGCNAPFFIMHGESYVRVNPSGVLDLATKPLKWERITVTSVGGNKVRLQSYWATYLTGTKNDTLWWQEFAGVTTDYWTLDAFVNEESTFSITSPYGASMRVREDGKQKGRLYLGVTKEGYHKFKFICSTDHSTTPKPEEETTTRPPTESTTMVTDSTTTVTTTTPTYKLPAERIEGPYCLKGVNLGKDVYVRSWEGPDGKSPGTVDVAPSCAEHFVIELSHGRVTIRSPSDVPKYLHAHANGYVDAEPSTKHIPTSWAPFDNEDGTWSFQSEDGRWLSSHEPNGTVTTMPHNKALEHFRLESILKPY